MWAPYVCAPKMEKKKRPNCAKRENCPPRVPVVSVCEKVFINVVLHSVWIESSFTPITLRFLSLCWTTFCSYRILPSIVLSKTVFPSQNHPLKHHTKKLFCLESCEF